MSDTSDGEEGPAQYAVELGLAFGIAAFGALVIIGALQVGVGWGDEGPQAGFFPFYVGLLLIVASGVNFFQAAHHSGGGTFAAWGQLRQVLSVVVPTAIYVLLIPWLGVQGSAFAAAVLNAIAAAVAATDGARRLRSRSACRWSPSGRSRNGFRCRCPRASPKTH